MIVIDTHVLIWWVSEPGRLSVVANEAITEASKQGRLLVSSFSVWEISMLNKAGRLSLRMPLEEWIAKIELLPIRFVPVDNTIATRSVSLEGFTHADPADRLIIATALCEQASLVTKDEKIRAYKMVKTIW